jgi:hypothetical protein
MPKKSIGPRSRPTKTSSARSQRGGGPLWPRKTAKGNDDILRLKQLLKDDNLVPNISRDCTQNLSVGTAFFNILLSPWLASSLLDKLSSSKGEHATKLATLVAQGMVAKTTPDVSEEALFGIVTKIADLGGTSPTLPNLVKYVVQQFFKTGEFSTSDVDSGEVQNVQNAVVSFVVGHNNYLVDVFTHWRNREGVNMAWSHKDGINTVADSALAFGPATKRITVVYSSTPVTAPQDEKNFKACPQTTTGDEYKSLESVFENASPDFGDNLVDFYSSLAGDTFKNAANKVSLPVVNAFGTMITPATTFAAAVARLLGQGETANKIDEFPETMSFLTAELNNIMGDFIKDVLNGEENSIVLKPESSNHDRGYSDDKIRCIEKFGEAATQMTRSILSPLKKFHKAVEARVDKLEKSWWFCAATPKHFRSILKGVDEALDVLALQTGALVRKAIRRILPDDYRKQQDMRFNERVQLMVASIFVRLAKKTALTAYVYYTPADLQNMFASKVAQFCDLTKELPTISKKPKNTLSLSPEGTIENAPAEGRVPSSRSGRGTRVSSSGSRRNSVKTTTMEQEAPAEGTGVSGSKRDSMMTSKDQNILVDLPPMHKTPRNNHRVSLSASNSNKSNPTTLLPDATKSPKRISKRLLPLEGYASNTISFNRLTPLKK